jgi:hypothetical protein
VPRPLTGPGLAKVRKLPAVSRRTLELIGLREGWLSSALDGADIVSEGSVAEEPDGSVYYGTTSVHCPVDRTALGEKPAISMTSASMTSAELLAVMIADPHARLRLLRLAHREAVVRATGSLHVLNAEISAQALDREGELLIAIVIDVSGGIHSVQRGAM